MVGSLQQPKDLAANNCELTSCLLSSERVLQRQPLLCSHSLSWAPIYLVGTGRWTSALGRLPSRLCSVARIIVGEEWLSLGLDAALGEHLSGERSSSSRMRASSAA